MGLTLEEQEVLIRWDRLNKTVTLYDCRQATYDRAVAAGYAPDDASILDGEIVGWCWRNIPKGEISLTRALAIRWGRSKRLGNKRSFGGDKPGGRG